MSRAQICIVDDNATWLAKIARLIQDADLGDAVMYMHPMEALVSLSARPPDVLLVDYNMPAMNGIEFLTALHAAGVSLRTPVALVAGVVTGPVKLQAWQAGAMEVLRKSAGREEITLRLRNLVRMAALSCAAHPTDTGSPTVARGASGEERSTLRVLERLSALRDETTGKHTERMARYAAVIAASLGLSPTECQRIQDAAPLHDLGKIGIPDAVLSKPGKLSKDEWDVMRRHTTIGYELLRDHDSPTLRMGAEIALLHHEHFDGGGYPLGLRGDNIAQSARIVALADVFDALTTVRPYKSAWLVEQAIDQIVEDSGTHFDPNVVNAFTSSIDELVAVKAHYDADEAYAPLVSLPV